MFWNAGLMVKFVMLLLLGFSFASWYIIFKKLFLFKHTRRESERFTKSFWMCTNLSDAFQFSEQFVDCPEANIFKLGYTELQKITTKRNPKKKEPETLKMRLAGMETLTRTLQKATSIEVSQLGKSLSLLATTGSTTPFIGLFGTVWGIMSSFQEIGMRGSASLAVVAPGISEALVATAAGLAVAIPAVVFYNHYANQLDELENDMNTFSADFLNLVERDILTRESPE